MCVCCGMLDSLVAETPDARGESRAGRDQGSVVAALVASRPAIPAAEQVCAKAHAGLDAHWISRERVPVQRGRDQGQGCSETGGRGSTSASSSGRLADSRRIPCRCSTTSSLAARAPECSRDGGNEVVVFHRVYKAASRQPPVTVAVRGTSPDQGHLLAEVVPCAGGCSSRLVPPPPNRPWSTCRSGLRPRPRE